MDLILSISVFIQGIQLQSLLDEKDDLYKELGYAEGRLTSPFLKTRKKQLRLISITYMAANCCVIAEIVLIFGVKSPSLHNCASLCAQPQTNGAAALLLSFVVIHLIPTHFFIYSFYIIPRRFNASHDEDNILLTGEAGRIGEPLLDHNLI